MVDEDEETRARKRQKEISIEYVEDDHIPFIDENNPRYDELNSLAAEAFDVRSKLFEKR